MDRHQQMDIFLAVAEHLSLAAAARRLRISAPTVTRALATLEARLGVALLERSTRGVQLTAAGEHFAEDSRRILAQVSEADACASGLHAQPRGRLTLAAPLLFGQHLLMPILLDYLAAYPEVKVLSHYMDRFPNLQEEAVDVGVLVGELPNSSLFALKVGSIRRVVCASPSYLAAHGEPQTPQALSGHRIIHSSADARLNEWRFNANGQVQTLSFQPRLSCATNQAAIAAAVAGAGLTRCMSYQIHRHIQQGQLRTLLASYQSAALPVHIVYREGRKAAARVRSFVDFTVARLRAEPSINTSE